MNLSLVKSGKYLLIVSVLLFVLGIVALFTVKLKFGIDFAGGTVITYKSDKNFSNEEIQKDLDVKKYADLKIQKTSDSTYSITTKTLSQDDLTTLESTIAKNLAVEKPQSVDTIGPTIGDELKSNAIKSISIVSICIVLYIAWAFRKVSKPVTSWIYGLSAVIAMVHDVVILIGIFALAGYFYGATVDSLFVTALLTVIGFSVHDTIVVFDRIRENLGKNTAEDFEGIVNRSLVETLSRSLNTSLTVILTLLTLFLLGGETIRWFSFALLIGMTSGTYSSIFVASQLLLLYSKFKENRKNKNLK